MTKKFNEDFITELFASLLHSRSKDFYYLLRQELKDNYIPNHNQRQFWKTIKALFDESVPTFGTIKQALRENNDLLLYSEEVKDNDDIAPDDVLNGFSEFIKQVKFIDIYEQAAELFKRDKAEEAYNIFIKGAEEIAGISFDDIEHTAVFGDFKSRYLDRISGEQEKARIPTGIDPLDAILNGGLEIAEILLATGQSGVGKSFFLIWLGLSAARRGYKVAHFQLEGTKDQVENRYDSAWSGVMFRDMKIGNISDARYKVLLKQLNKIGKGEVYVKAYEKFESATLQSIRKDLKEMKKLYGNIDLIIIDYFELCEVGDGITYKPTEERFRQNKLGNGFKNLAMESGSALVTASQASDVHPDKLNDPDFVLTRHDMAENKGKIRPFDVHVTINQTREEKKDKLARLYIDKAREHEVFEPVMTIVQNLGRSRFFNRKKTLELFYSEDDE